MKLGYNTGYWSAGPPAGVENVVAECDKLGFEHIWTAEAYGSDALSPSLVGVPHDKREVGNSDHANVGQNSRSYGDGCDHNGPP